MTASTRHRHVKIRWVAIPMEPKPCAVCQRKLDGILIVATSERPPRQGDLTACPHCHTPLAFGKEGFELVQQYQIDRLRPADRELFMLMVQSDAVSVH